MFGISHGVLDIPSMENIRFYDVKNYEEWQYQTYYMKKRGN